MKKAVTIHQPYVDWIFTGEKTEEYRSWPTKFRGTMYIHAASRKKSLPTLRECEPEGWKELAETLPFGAIVGTVELVDCRPDQGQDGGSDLFQWQSDCPHCGQVQGIPRKERSHCCEECGKSFEIRGSLKLWLGNFVYSLLLACVLILLSPIALFRRFMGHGQQETGFAWQLRNPRRLPQPIPCKGQLGIWNIPDEVCRLLENVGN